MQPTAFGKQSGLGKILLAGCLLLISLPSIGKGPTTRLVRLHDEPVPSLSFYQVPGNGKDGNGSKVVLTGHQRDGGLLWKRTLRGSGHLLPGPIELAENYIVVTAKYAGVADLGGLTFNAEDRSAVLYAIYNFDGQLLAVGNLECDGDVTPISIKVGPSGTTLTVVFSGIHVILPLPEPDEMEDSSATYFFDNYGFMRVEQLSLEKAEMPQFDWTDDSILTITESGSSTDDPEGDPTTPAQGGGS